MLAPCPGPAGLVVVLPIGPWRDANPKQSIVPLLFRLILVPEPLHQVSQAIFNAFHFLNHLYKLILLLSTNCLLVSSLIAY